MAAVDNKETDKIAVSSTSQAEMRSVFVLIQESGIKYIIQCHNNHA